MLTMLLHSTGPLLVQLLPWNGSVGKGLQMVTGLAEEVVRLEYRLPNGIPLMDHSLKTTSISTKIETLRNKGSLLDLIAVVRLCKKVIGRVDN
jgi:hypothetical protein